MRSGLSSSIEPSEQLLTHSNQYRHQIGQRTVDRNAYHVVYQQLVGPL